MFKWFESRVNPYPETPLSLNKTSLLGFIWQCTAGLRGWILTLLLLTACLGAFEAYLFKMLGQVVDWLTHTPQALFWQTHGHAILIMALLIMFVPIVVAIHSLIRFQTLQGAFPMRLRYQFHQHMLGQSLSFYQDEFAGRVSSKVMQTALAVRDTVMTLTDMLVYVGVYFISTLWVMFSFNGLLIWPFIGWMILYFLTIAYFIPRLSRSAAKQADARALMTGRITDAYSNISIVKLFAHSHREKQYAQQAMREFLGTVHGQMRLVSQFEISNQLLNTGLFLSLGCIAFSAWGHQGATSIGAIAAAIALALRLQGISHWIMWEMATLFENVGTVKDGLRTLTIPHHIQDAPNAPPLQLHTGKIAFRDVNFAYPNGKHVLQHFNLNIHAGEKIGIIGRSGAGKSTLVNLLLRFYDVNGGEITIDDQPIHDVQQESLRQHIAVVTQDTALLHRTIKENILYGNPTAREEQVIAAAQQAHAHDFIQTLQDANGNTAYDVEVGERGVKLSGGQRQRIAISRVMLKNAPILVLDEATSALDSEVEAAIQENLMELMQGKTVIAIAHRLSTIAQMDRLIVLDQGQIIEEGTHHSLLLKGGVYAQLWQRQSGGFLDVGKR